MKGVAQTAPARYAEGTKGADYETLGRVPASARLGRIRRDLLEAPYRLCTRKASLLTQYFRENSHADRLTAVLSGWHYKAYARALEKIGRDIPLKRWQAALGNGLNAFYVKREKRSPGRTQIEYAKALRFILEQMELRVYDGELIVGNLSSCRIGAPLHPDLGGLLMLPELEGLDTRAQNPLGIEEEQRAALMDDIFPYWFNRSVLARAPLHTNNAGLFDQLMDGSHFVLTQISGVSHVTPDYSSVIEKGFAGIRDEVAEKLDAVNARLAGGQIEDQTAVQAVETQRDFYEASLIVAEAAMAYGERWHTHLLGLAKDESEPSRKQELLDLAEIFRRVPREPAATFHEAVQSMFIAHVIVHQESFQHGVSFGRVDQYLHPFYERDIAEGRLTPEAAVEILGCFLGKAAELLPLFFNRATEYFSGLSSASGVTLGGVKADGSDAVNPVSFLMLQAYDQMRLRQPNLHVRVHTRISPPFLNLCYDVLKKGGGLPAFFNDEAIVPAIQGGAVEFEDAQDYSVVGCVEWGCTGNSFPAAGAVFLNLPMALHLALHNGEYRGKQFGPFTGSLDDLSSMDAVITAFRKQLQHLMQIVVEGNNAIETAHALHRPTPFLSIIVDGCIEKGIEVNSGGAVYNTSGCQGVGLADVVDSLCAIEAVVFKKRQVSLPALVRIVDNNFAGQGNLRSFILNRTPKYGEDNPVADRFAWLVSGLFSVEVRRHTNGRGGSYAPGFWSMTTHQGFGARMPALPSGRLEGEALSNGASPCNGRERKGPTAALSSVAHLQSGRITNGYALNQKVHFDYVLQDDGNVILDGLVQGFFRKGGMQVQFNILDPEVLRDAKAHPENYRDLVVRVSGYSAYFNDLTESMKDEIIARTLHDGCGC